MGIVVGFGDCLSRFKILDVRERKAVAWDVFTISPEFSFKQV